MNESTATAAPPADDDVPPSADFGPVRVYFGDRNGKYPDGNQVIVRGRDTVAAFDTPLVSNRIGAELLDADLVILSHMHEDHSAGLWRLPDADVYVHEADLAALQSWEGLAAHYGYSAEVLEQLRPQMERDMHYAPRPDAKGYRDGAEWDLGGVRVRAIHLPGHTSGHCALIVEPHGIAFVADIDFSRFGPYYGDATSSLRDFRTTLARVESIPAQVWITSHNKGVLTERASFVAALRAFAARIDDREARILEVLRERPRSLDELVAIRVVYRPEAADVWVDAAERRHVALHLDELVAQGRILAGEDGRFRPCA